MVIAGFTSRSPFFSYPRSWCTWSLHSTCRRKACREKPRLRHGQGSKCP
jgi:hypothetical protein